MPWFAAHAIMYVQFREGPQDHFPVWENVLLIEATDGEAAHVKAYARAKRDEADDPSFTWEGRPARWVLAGIRKVMTVAHDRRGDELGDGDEVTFNEFDLPDKESVTRLVANQGVRLDFEAE